MFSWTGGSPYFKQNFPEFLVEVQGLNYIYELSVLNLLGRVRYLMPCESLDEFSRNWDPHKGTLQLSRVDLFESRRDNFIVIKARFSKIRCHFQSPVDIGCIPILV